MSERPRIYLDHAATSWPKSEIVLTAMDRFARDIGAAAGRGGYRSAMDSDAVVAATRRAIAHLIHAESPQCVSLHSSGTAALNAAIHGIVRPGDHVVSCAAEHNSVLRPLRHLQLHAGIELTVVDVDRDGRVDADALMAAVTPETRLVALTAASNVSGAVQPITEIGRRLSDHPAAFLCDAAQTFGHLPIDVDRDRIDLLAAPGHKGSGGPLGTGFLYVAAGWHPQMRPAMQGGTGSQSESLEMPDSMPSMLEPGNLNVPALAGWLEALKALQSRDWQAHHEHQQRLARRLRQGLQAIEGLTVFGGGDELPIASVAVAGLSPSDLAAILDAEFGIETRAGLHCAALIHTCLGSDPEGTLRISAGSTTTEQEIDAGIEALRQITVGMSGEA